MRNGIGYDSAREHEEEQGFMFGSLAIVSFAVFAAAGDSAGTFKTVTVPAVDEASKDASFVAFRDALRDAVAKRDVEAVLRIVDPEIKCGFGGEDGKDNFINAWNLAVKPAESMLWRELGEVLRLGGRFEDSNGDKQFIAPYTFLDMPDEFDSFENAIVVGDGVRVREAPRASSAQIAKVDRIVVRAYPEAELVEEEINGEKFPWRAVGLPDGRKGFIWGKFVRMPVETRAGFSKKSGEWKMVFLVAGD